MSLTRECPCGKNLFPIRDKDPKHLAMPLFQKFAKLNDPHSAEWSPSFQCQTRYRAQFHIRRHSHREVLRQLDGYVRCWRLRSHSWQFQALEGGATQEGGHG